MAKLNYDGLVNAPAKEVAEAGFSVIDALQKFPPHTRASATAAVFLLLCEEFRAQPQDVFTATKNLLASKDAGQSDHIAALRLYVTHEARK
jgi:hypothetical protein